MSVVILVLVIAVLVGVLTGALRRQSPQGAMSRGLKFVLLVPAVLVAVGITFMLMARATVRQTRSVAVQWEPPVTRQMTVPAHDTQNLYAAQEHAVAEMQQIAEQVEAADPTVAIKTAPEPQP